MMEAADVEIKLTRDEALVLFEFLKRYSDKDELKIEDQAEQRCLWDLCGHLEKTLVEPLQTNYEELLISARERLRDSVT